MDVTMFIHRKAVLCVLDSAPPISENGGSKIVLQALLGTLGLIVKGYFGDNIDRPVEDRNTATIKRSRLEGTEGRVALIGLVGRHTDNSDETSAYLDETRIFKSDKVEKRQIYERDVIVGGPKVIHGSRIALKSLVYGRRDVLRVSKACNERRNKDLKALVTNSQMCWRVATTVSDAPDRIPVVSRRARIFWERTYQVEREDSQYSKSLLD